jgi:hypothetical protein
VTATPKRILRSTMGDDRAFDAIRTRGPGDRLDPASRRLITGPPEPPVRRPGSTSAAGGVAGGASEHLKLGNGIDVTLQQPVPSNPSRYRRSVLGQPKYTRDVARSSAQPMQAHQLLQPACCMSLLLTVVAAASAATGPSARWLTTRLAYADRIALGRSQRIGFADPMQAPFATRRTCGGLFGSNSVCITIRNRLAAPTCDDVPRCAKLVNK